QYQLAHALSKVLPDPIDSFYFVNSGSEATEGAMKLAKRYTGRAEFIACRNAYHGSTQGSASLMAPTDFTQAYHPLLPGIKHIEYNCNFCLQKITTATAAVIVEPVQAEWGIRPPFQDFLQQVRKRCDETGALLIFDEIQTGFGRTGAFFACQKYGVTPDIILMAKGMGGGMPIGAFGASREIMQVLSHNPILGHITTFGGHPVSCAASLATLKVLQEEDYIAQVEEKEKLFHQLLKHPHIREVRSSGLMMGVQLDSFPQVQKVIEYCLANGVITDWFLFNSETIRIAPPLIIEQAEIEFACEILLKGIDFAKQN
ncbi:MAG: aspartate aminotransferase family protein, partial [Bacteroidota bacterium]